MNSPAILTYNKYGYRLNLQNHQIRRLYDRYKDSQGLPYYMSISDEQRREFENMVLTEYGKLYQNKYGEKYNYPGLNYQREQMNDLIDHVTLGRKEE